MSDFYSSGNVRVFPSAYRGINASAAGKFTSEWNITNILKAISTDDSFVVDFSGTASTAGTLKVVIGGYYFEVDNLKMPSSGDLWLGIHVPNTNYLSNYDDNSTKLDDNNYFTGLAYFSSEPAKDKTLFPRVKVWDGATAKLCSTGYIKALTDPLGNWFNISTLLTPNGYIDGTKIDFTTITGYLDIIVRGAIKIVDTNGVGRSAGNSGDTLIYFDNGELKESKKNIGGVLKPVYVSTGKITELSGTAGKIGTASGTNIVSREVYVNSGTITEGNATTISMSAPSGATNGDGTAAKNGDLWFVIGG